MSVLSQASVGDKTDQTTVGVSELNEHEEVPTGAKEATVKDSTETVTGFSATAVTPNILKSDGGCQ